VQWLRAGAFIAVGSCTCTKHLLKIKVYYLSPQINTYFSVFSLPLSFLPAGDMAGLAALPGCTTLKGSGTRDQLAAKPAIPKAWLQTGFPAGTTACLLQTQKALRSLLFPCP
jgi:hypothetical protein